jgi:NADP-dependent 3-hydroxy acid dehydrogenase YdfG
VFVVTGAAGSIVSAITADLAGAYPGTFHLLDLAPLPDRSDPDLHRYATDRDGFKAELAGRLSQRGERPTPVLIERELARFERAQAALSAVTAIEAAGGSAHYHRVDLTDATAVEKVLAEIRDVSGRVDALVHAAGVEVSHALPDKTPEEFGLVLSVKADGLFNLLHAARGLPLGAVVAFSSVAGRFGNAGQTDYSAANDLQCKVLSGLRRDRPDTRVLALDWTAWAGIGMATRGSIPKIMEMAGVDLLPPETGVPWLRRELAAGVPAPEVVVAGALGAMAAPFHETGGLDQTAVPARGAVLAGAAVSLDVRGGLAVRATLDPATRPFLDHHRIDGTPVLPGVMGIEAFTEAATLLAPDRRVARVEAVDFRSPVKFHRDEPRTLTVTALLRPDGPDLVAECALRASRKLPGRDEPRETVHFTGRVRLTADGQVPPEDGAAPVAGDTGPGVPPEQVYRLYFHGPAYRVVAGAWPDRGGAAGGVRARLADDLPAQADAPTLVGPRLIELCFQAAGLYEAGHAGRLALPLHVDAVRLGADVAERAGLVATARPDGRGGFDCVVSDRDGGVALRLDGYRTVPLPDPPPDEVLAPIQAALRG